MSTAEPRYCYRHPDRETGLSCSDCGRPICADCATFAPVGIRCPDHAGAQGGKKPRQIKPPTVRRAPGISLATGSAPVTKALIAINVAIYLITVVQGLGLNNPRAVPAACSSQVRCLVRAVSASRTATGIALVTAMFLHGILRTSASTCSRSG